MPAYVSHRKRSHDPLQGASGHRTRCASPGSLPDAGEITFGIHGLNVAALDSKVSGRRQALRDTFDRARPSRAVRPMRCTPRECIGCVPRMRCMHSIDAFAERTRAMPPMHACVRKWHGCYAAIASVRSANAFVLCVHRTRAFAKRIRATFSLSGAIGRASRGAPDPPFQFFQCMRPMQALL